MIDIPYEVKRALRLGRYRKNYKIKVYRIEGDERVLDFLIDNDTLVKESVSIDERMASGSELKFGLCEGSSIEFQYFNHPNIRGREIQIFISVEYLDSNNDRQWYDIPMGWYTVEECPMQFSTGIYKATAINKLRSDYLDAKANEYIENMQSDTADEDIITLETIQNLLLEGYEITPKEQKILVNKESATTTGAGVPNVTFKLNGSNTTYSAYMRRQMIPFWDDEERTLHVEYRYKVEIDKYLIKLKSVVADLKETIYEKCQNPDEVWRNITNSSLYQVYCGASASFGGSESVTDCYALDPSGLTYWNPYHPEDRLWDIEKLSYMYGANALAVYFPVKLEGKDSNNIYVTVWETDTRMLLDDIVVSEITSDDIENILIDKTDLADVTLRDITSANYELHCQYGKLDRITDLFSGVELNGGGLYPADNLYPANNLYPQGNALHPMPSEYSKLWTDTVGEQSFRYLIVTYKTTVEEEGQLKEVEKTLQRTVNANGTTDYNMTDNWLLRNLIWTDEQVGEYADDMVIKMQGIRWFPFEMWAVGLPHIETGDAIEITDRQGNTYTSYILERQLRGIHNLQDTFVNGELDIF